MTAPWPPAGGFPAPGGWPPPAGAGTTGGPLPSGPRRRGQGLARATLAVVVLAACSAGVGVFGALDAADVISVDPVGPSLGWIVLAGAGLVAGLVAFLAAVVAVAWCRPRWVAVLALAAAVVLPAVAVAVGAGLGWAALKLHVAQDLSGDAPVLAGTARDVLDGFGITGSLRDLLDRWATG